MRDSPLLNLGSFDHVSFQGVFGFSHDDESDAPAERRQPVWFGPPDNELGIAVSIARVIAQSEAGIVAVSHAVAYSTGLTFEFVAEARGLSAREERIIFHEQHIVDDDELPDGFLRIGVKFAEQRRASNLGGRRMHRQLMTSDATPDDPVLMPRGGGGGQASHGRVSLRPGYWLWPLPPLGAFEIACEWPIVGIPLTAVEIDGSALVEASSRSSTFWQSPPP